MRRSWEETSLAPHRLQAEGLPSFTAPTCQRPSLPDGAEARAVAAAGPHLLFRLHIDHGAEAGGHRPGIYRQPIGGGPDDLELLAADEGGGVLLEPQAAGDVVLLKRSLPSGAPSASAEVIFAHAGAEAVVVPGQEVSVSADGSTAAVLDASGGLWVVELGTTLEARSLLPMSVDDAQQLPLPALTPDGSTVMVSRAGALVAVDVSTGKVEILMPAAENVVMHSICALGPQEAVALVATASEEHGPAGELVRVAGGVRTSLWTAPLAQPRIAPVVVDEHVFAALTLEPYGAATYGPVHLVVMPLSGGAQAPVVELGGGPLRMRRLDDDLCVEGGDALLRLPLTS
jgi:hypothetical protein